MSDNVAASPWPALFAACAPRPAPPTAQTFIRSWPSASHPVAVGCDDGRRYVIKGRHLDAGRVACNEQIVGLLGRALGAPVGEVALVDVPAELIALQPEMQHLSPGIAHGSLYLPGLSNDREPLQHFKVPENRDRFAHLAVLYGWVGASDHQFIYENAPPHRVFSVDHGHFFNGPAWTVTSLKAMSPPRIDPYFDLCVFSRAELQSARSALHNVVEDDIAVAVTMPPDDWGITLEERIAMAEYLADRRGTLLAAL